MKRTRPTGAPPLSRQLWGQVRCASGFTYAPPALAPAPLHDPVLSPSARLLARLNSSPEYVSLSVLATEFGVPVREIRNRFTELEEEGRVRIRSNTKGMTGIIICETRQALKIGRP
jgi:predicted ArsR family transcriptional regulator